MNKWLLTLGLVPLVIGCESTYQSSPQPTINNSLTPVYYEPYQGRRSQPKSWQWDHYEPIPREYDNDLADYTVDDNGKPQGIFREIIPGCAACGHRWEADETSTQWRRNPYRGERFRNKVRNFAYGSSIGLDGYINP